MKYNELDIKQKEECKIEIYNLRKQGLTYAKIVKELEKQGIKISLATVGGICKEIYALRGEVKPDLRGSKEKVNGELIYELRKNGLSYREILNELEKQGIKIHYNTVRKICKEIYTLKGEINPKGKLNKNIDEEIYRLREKRTKI